MAAVPAFGPFPETAGVLAALQSGDYEIAIISTTDDDLISQNLARIAYDELPTLAGVPGLLGAGRAS